MSDNEEFKVVDATHPLDWRINASGAVTKLVLITCKEPKNYRSSRGVSVSKAKRSDGWALLFSLTDNGPEERFLAFVKDVVESSRNICPQDATDFVLGRYAQWKSMFESVRKRLQDWQIQGIIGEILTIRDVLIPRYGEEDALRAWMNALGGKQDFACFDVWYETKAVKEGKSVVRISSLDQLDRDDPGRLVVVTLRDSSTISPLGMTLNSLYSAMVENLSAVSRELFINIMSDFGYDPKTVYDPCYELVKIREYEVKEGFPRLRGSELEGKGIVNAEYDISLNAMFDFKVR
jgi:hypothetical protein